MEAQLVGYVDWAVLREQTSALGRKQTEVLASFRSVNLASTHLQLYLQLALGNRHLALVGQLQGDGIEDLQSQHIVVSAQLPQ